MPERDPTAGNTNYDNNNNNNNHIVINNGKAHATNEEGATSSTAHLRDSDSAKVAAVNEYQFASVPLTAGLQQLEAQVAALQQQLWDAHARDTRAALLLSQQSSLHASQQPQRTAMHRSQQGPQVQQQPSQLQQQAQPQQQQQQQPIDLHHSHQPQPHQPHQPPQPSSLRHTTVAPSLDTIANDINNAVASTVINVPELADFVTLSSSGAGVLGTRQRVAAFKQRRDARSGKRTTGKRRTDRSDEGDDETSGTRGGVVSSSSSSGRADGRF